ncbi:hypothetical protein ALQ25_200017 [Pseudomonas coronafaciens pv. atropurpurea]|nr:hypothetical protein ALQ25_200017 [Pseudomonas coronafaciens pv. atropurpurea]
MGMMQYEQLIVEPNSDGKGALQRWKLAGFATCGGH